MNKLFLLIAVPIAAHAGGLVLKPLNPIPIADDAFRVKIDLRPDILLPQPEWVALSGAMREHRFLDREAPHLLSTSREAEIRFFLLAPSATFQDLVRDIGRLRSMGFRPTSLRHLMFLASGPSLRLLNPGVAVICSEPPVVKGLSGPLEFDNALFVASIREGKTIEIGLIGEPTLRTFSHRIVILEAPP